MVSTAVSQYKNIKYFIKGLIVLIALFVISPVNADDKPLARFVTAERFYKEKEYKKAIEQYELIIKDGEESGQIYYNLANSYFKNGNYGKAVLNYERAKRIMPRDRDVDYNYKYVLKLIKDFGSENKGFMIKIIDKFTGFHSDQELVTIGVTIGLVALGLYLLFLFMKVTLIIGKIILVVLSVLAVVYMGGFKYKVQKQVGTAVILDNSDARFEPREDATIHFKLNEGNRVKMMKFEGGWVKIKRADNKQGWVQQINLEGI
ncbi:MAG: tetratricopeptide repeat protein [Candidatus Omnitrophica bacterium]|nr:tetratricopeptide repeat protein [Candidatus Omnitrophota bacterium]